MRHRADTAQIRVVACFSQRKSMSCTGAENSSQGTTARVAPTLTDTSKSKGAWLAMTSCSVMENSAVKQSIKSVTLRLHTTIPLGTPVEPEVKFT